MSVSDMISLGSAIATFLGALVAAVALWRQLAKLNQQLTLQHFADYTKRYQEIIVRFPEDINRPDFQAGDVSDEKYRNTMRAMRIYFDLCFEEWYLQQLGFIDKRVWGVWSGGISTAMSKTAFRDAWKIIIQDTKYGADFEQFIESLQK